MNTVSAGEVAKDFSRLGCLAAKAALEWRPGLGGRDCEVRGITSLYMLQCSLDAISVARTSEEIRFAILSRWKAYLLSDLGMHVFCYDSGCA